MKTVTVRRRGRPICRPREHVWSIARNESFWVCLLCGMHRVFVRPKSRARIPEK